jgi:hypothetical protein
MTRFGLTSLAFVLGLACALPAATTLAQAQGTRDPANARNLFDQQDPNKSRLNDPANARNLYDQQDPKNSRLNDPANARNLTDQQDPKNSRLNDPNARRDPADGRGTSDKDSKRDVK